MNVPYFMIVITDRNVYKSSELFLPELLDFCLDYDTNYQTYI